MKEKTARFKGVATKLLQLSDGVLRVMMDRFDDEVQPFLETLERRVMEETYFTYLSDEEAIEVLVTRKEYERTEAERIVREWRQIATSLGYTGPVAVMVRSGFALKTHAPKLGPCYEQWAYLQDWTLKNDAPTADSLAFFVPRLVANSTSKNKDEQIQLLSELRKLHELPEHHLASFGDASMLAGLILLHFKRTGERTPLNGDYVRTDTVRTDGWRLLLGRFGDYGLDCHRWCCSGGGRSDVRLGCFALGVESLGT